MLSRQKLSASSISNVDIGIDYSDPYEGQTNAAGRPGYPVTFVAAVDRAGATGAFSNILLDVIGNGSSESGLLIGFGAAAAGAIRAKRLQLTNVNRSNAAGQGGVFPQSPITIEGIWSVVPFAGDEVVVAYEANVLATSIGRGGFDTSKVYKVGGVQVVSAQLPAVADAGGAAAAPTQAEFNALAAQLNTLLSRVRQHGLIAP